MIIPMVMLFIPVPIKIQIFLNKILFFDITYEAFGLSVLI